MNAVWERLTKDLPPHVTRVLASAFSLALGLVVALVLHYALYRMGLPSKPFIYVAF